MSQADIAGAMDVVDLTQARRIITQLRAALAGTRTVRGQLLPYQASRIRCLRGNLTRRDASDIAGVAVSTWTQWEVERHPAKLHWLEGFEDRAKKRFPDYQPGGEAPRYGRRPKPRPTAEDCAHVRALRGSLTQEQAGEVVGRSARAWGGWERGVIPAPVACMKDFEARAKAIFKNYKPGAPAKRGGEP